MQTFIFPLNDDENVLEVLYSAVSADNYEIELYSYYGTDVTALINQSPQIASQAEAALKEHLLNMEQFMEE